MSLSDVLARIDQILPEPQAPAAATAPDATSSGFADLLSRYQQSTATGSAHTPGLYDGESDQTSTDNQLDPSLLFSLVAQQGTSGTTGLSDLAVRYQPSTATSSARTPGLYDGELAQAANENQLDPALLYAVVKQESGFNPNATSAAGAQGLMQLMPATARALGVTDPYDPAQSISAGARYLRQNLDRFGGNVSLALAAYNAGPGAVEQFRGIPPYAETQHYVQQILSTYNALTGGTEKA